MDLDVVGNLQVSHGDDGASLQAGDVNLDGLGDVNHGHGHAQVSQLDGVHGGRGSLADYYHGNLNANLLRAVNDHEVDVLEAGA